MISLDTNSIQEDPNDTNNEQELSDDVQELEIGKLKAEIDGLKAKNEDSRNDTKLKKKLAERTFRFMEGFVTLIFVYLTYYICYFTWYRMEVPKEVVIALITTSLAAVVGLVGFILKGLFGSK
ncbi:hypothetical protein [Pleionea mediterranea]|uniref:Uncharacterized protein n=1 Tax=Pleionea mediterranea TaxID=523701 RepID=A0A316FZ93_9GAMM|nr:hypothetical protein [Pleionea mediterranea]PWK52860.1 hypothetical protein C8D97_10478 [Pleionea mediterranea]